MMKPGLRGGAGVVNCHTSGTTAGPACAPELVNLFTFAVRLGKSPATRAKRAAAVAEHVDAVPGAVVIEECPESDVVWLALAVRPPIRASEAQRATEGCPHYVAGSFKIVGG